MKKAIAILNRNLPKLTDDLVESLKSEDIDADIFVLENGSDKDKYSKYANLFEETSNGPAWGCNRLLQHCLDEGYDYIWLCLNDAKVNKPKEFFNWAVEQMENDESVGICVPVWGSMWNINGVKMPTSAWHKVPRQFKSFSLTCVLVHALLVIRDSLV